MCTEWRFRCNALLPYPLSKTKRGSMPPSSSISIPVPGNSAPGNKGAFGGSAAQERVQLEGWRTVQPYKTLRRIVFDRDIGKASNWALLQPHM